MNANSGEWSERNIEEIEENVLNYMASYKLDPDKVRINNISVPSRLPSGEEHFTVYIDYLGEPNFFMALRGDPDTLLLNEPEEHIVKEIFNELYLQGRYEEFKPAIDYLESLEVEDPLRPNETTFKYFHTSVGVDQDLNEEIKAVFWESNENFDQLKDYIDQNMNKIIRKDTNMSIEGLINDLDKEKAREIENSLLDLLPPTNYVVNIEVDRMDIDESEERLNTYLQVKGR